MPRPTLLLIAPPVLHAAGWWARSVASKPHLESLAGFVRDLADVRVLELDRMLAGLALPDDADSGAAPGPHDADASPAALRDAIDAALASHLDAATGLVGISCWTSLHYLGAVAVARRVRALAPRVPIVVGGHHATALPADFTDGALADWVVCGDGEHTLRDLCAAWPRRPPEPQVLQGRPFDLTEAAHIDWEHYADRLDDRRVLWLELSRGCPFACTFCVEPERGPRWSALPVARALDILETLAARYGPRVVCFSDAIFGANRAWTEAFVRGLEARALPLMLWAQTRGDLMAPALLERLHRCHFKLDFGLDTGSAAMVERMVKHHAPARYLAASRASIRHAHRIGLHHDVYLIFNYPGETPETVRETQRFVTGLGRGCGGVSGFVSSQPFFILPGTAVYAQRAALAARWGTEIRHPHWWRERREQHALATDVLPSAAWAGREDELGAFMRWQQALNERWVARYPVDVHLFRTAFHGGGGAVAAARGTRTRQVGSAFA